MPFVALVPDHAPDAEQVVALLAVHASIDALPLLTVLGVALKLTLTVGCALTVTVADCVALPPGPLQVKVYAALALSGPVDDEPLSALLPDHAPEAVHAVAAADVQVSVALAPPAMALGPTLRLTDGAGDLMDTVADCDALPPGPVQVRT